jgi:putative cardiolipin synthase
MAPTLSYHVLLEKNQLVWVTEDDGKQHTLTREPGSWWRRFNSWLSSTIGLEKML